MFYHNIDPVLFHIFGLEVRFYGLFYLLSFILAYFLIKTLAKENKLNLKKEDIFDFLFYTLVGGIVGARIGYVLSHLSNYSNNLLSGLYIWQGGLAFHGGLIGAIIVALVFCKKKKVNFYKLADVTVIPLALGIGLVRIANFLNGELYGRLTNLPWGVKFKDVQGFRHPYQIYSSIKGILIFCILFFVRKKKHKDGFIFWLFISLYSLFRLIIEFYKEQILLFYGISFTQILSIIMFLIGIYFVFKKR